MILQVLSSIIPIVFLIVLGFILHEKQFLTKGLDRNLTFLVMNVALPASVFLSVVNNLTVKTLEELAKPLAIGLLAFAANYSISYVLMRLVRVPRGRRGVFLNTIVNANTIFIGMPLNQALFGTEAVSYFLVYYVLNTLSTWTIGSVLIARDSRTEQASGGKMNLKQISDCSLRYRCCSSAFICRSRLRVHSRIWVLWSPRSLCSISALCSRRPVLRVFVLTRTQSLRSSASLF